ncbi:MAG: hypothetical protein NC428_09455, partial [Clostridium sp.]|nr:hypothetical protein [Clostridium sp.]
IYIYVSKYNILGLTVGDDRKKIDTVMEKYGYRLTIDRESYIRYKKGEISISFSFKSRPYVVVSVHRVTLDDILGYY